ncbi:hypothetical protein TWF173_004585 [Orbilia oligospora]|nr:hypothetical protein TWF173_004585 [Orbilia oligospora]
MAPSYHLAPNFRTVPPPNGPLAIGTLITDIESCDPINQDKQVEISEQKIYRFHVEGFSSTRERMLKGELGIWAKFVAMEGIGIDLSFSAEQIEGLEFKFKGLDTEEFNPTREYIAACMELAEVKDYFDYSQSKPPVYLITGLMVAREPSVTVRTERGRRIAAEIGVNIPNTAEVGPRGNLESEAKNSIIVSKSDDFVVGLRLRKIWYKRSIFDIVSGKASTLGDKLHSKGALLGVDETKDDAGDFEDEEANNIEDGTVAFVETSGDREINWIVTARK